MRHGRAQIAALLAVLLWSLPLISTFAADESFADWVRVLYQGALAMREADSELSDQDIQALFTPEVQKLRAEAANRVMPPTEPEGPILHILFGWGALPHRKLEIVSVQTDGADGAIVNLTIDGNARPLRLTGMFNDAGKSWQIDDIEYGSGGPDRTLRGRLARMQSWAPR